MIHGVTTAEALRGMQVLGAVLRGAEATQLRCWWCDVETDGLVEVTTIGGAQRRYIANWPDGDHVHTAEPPTPAQLEQAGHEALMRIRGAAG